MQASAIQDLTFQVIEFLNKKSEFCDDYDWNNYLALYDEDSTYHVPQWIDEHHYVEDPNQGLSYIYYADRTGLEDRVFRIRTGKAASATPLPRTLHMVSNVRVKTLPNDLVEAKVNWQTLYNRQGIDGTFYGKATYVLRPVDGSFRICRQHTLLLNDKIDSVLDFYHL